MSAVLDLQPRMVLSVRRTMEPFGTFSRLVRETRPHLVTMENVPRLERENVSQTS